MPYMQTDLQKIMGHQFSDEKIQYLIYQVLKGLKVSRVWKITKQEFDLVRCSDCRAVLNYLKISFCGNGLHRGQIPIFIKINVCTLTYYKRSQFFTFPMLF